MIAHHVGRHLGWHDGAQRARALLQAAYTSNTKRNYMAAWERFTTYCKQHGLSALPADYTTVATYVGWLHRRGTVAHGSFGAYSAPIDTVHALAGYSPPTAHPIFKRLKKGYLRLDAARAGAMPAVSAPLPATVVARALALATSHDATQEQRRVCAGSITAYLSFNRPGAASAMRTIDCTFSPDGLQVQTPFHKSETRTRTRAAFTIPVHPKGYKHGAPLRFLRDFHTAHRSAGGSLHAPLFSPAGATLGPRVTTRWLQQVLQWFGLSPPLGCRWTGKSIRSGAATAANSVGVPLPVVAAYMIHKESATTARYYVDARTLPTDAAWDFFARYISRWDGTRDPAQRVGYA